MPPMRTVYMRGLACLQRRDTAKAKAAYQDFFTLWKDADRRNKWKVKWIEPGSLRPLSERLRI